MIFKEIGAGKISIKETNHNGASSPGEILGGNDQTQKERGISREYHQRHGQRKDEGLESLKVKLTRKIHRSILDRGG